ncbi:hypothetical protein ACP70R_027886 [Stipagrostis hirtigluma subsp. patula]
MRVRNLAGVAAAILGALNLVFEDVVTASKREEDDFLQHELGIHSSTMKGKKQARNSKWSKTPQ